ncbi:efflux RND transporter periplasmic adaptor subunit [Thalassobellus citreus]|uniref:efflux RND transporter periplasmic adaptor subunit n=1 Tax=Thalassobellus citreus TaxID=3367752 RepID=UPI00379AE182
MTKKNIAYIIGAIVLIIVAYSLLTSSTDENSSLTVKVTKGTFLDEVVTSGEAQSTSSKEIKGPMNLRKFKIREVKIQDLVAEGTTVKKGDYVAKLDGSDVNEKIIDAKLNLETAQSKFTQKQLDTTLTLKQERNAIQDLLFRIEDDRLELKSSMYEPPTTIRKLEINIEKNERDLKEKEQDYSIKKRQADAEMVEVGTEVLKIKKRLDDLYELQKSFTIYSDANGMVTYYDRWGSKVKVGSSVYAWNPIVATLPDLTKMESKTYSNEVDIRKIKKDLPVKIGFDAFPDIEVEGLVTSVANVGEKKKGSDVKLFRVLIKLNTTNNSIKPGMTTSNRILTNLKKDVLMLPLEAIFSKDSISYTYLKSGYSIKKKQVKLGLSNNEVVIIEKGLEENDIVYLNKPEDTDDQSITLLK